MAQTTVVNARIDGGLLARLDKIAGAYDRPRGWVIARALERYLDEEIDLIDSLADAESDFAAGRFFTQEEMEARFNVKRAERDAA